ncbi:MAG: hypothetical protein IPF98_09110 [Gemmatimonadetes bacterium]|nr:hypothetical protein [Gemmatimonadota bacterium]MCC6771950.1 hypothetical protein [Gemmatimonadaceae bacterium]
MPVVASNVGAESACSCNWSVLQPFVLYSASTCGTPFTTLSAKRVHPSLTC